MRICGQEVHWESICTDQHVRHHHVHQYKVEWRLYLHSFLIILGDEVGKKEEAYQWRLDEEEKNASIGNNAEDKKQTHDNASNVIDSG